MSDAEQEITTVMRALQYMRDTYKNKFVRDELDAIETVQSALARISLNEHYRPESAGIVPLSPGDPDQGK